MEVLSGEKVVKASSINWKKYKKNIPFLIRQKPGKDNALGKMKFLFPNNFSIYLHDTPSKSLFNRSKRDFSHGCIRVENPMKFDYSGSSYKLQQTTKHAHEILHKNPNENFN